MLNKLQIKNFKGWRDTGEIRMAPITLFFGANSSGKSSIGQFLMMLKQTVESQDRKAVFFPGSKNSAIQLGSYREMVYHRNLNNKIVFSYQWKLAGKLKITDITRKSNNTYIADELNFDSSVSSQENGSIRVDKLDYNLYNKNESQLKIGMQVIPDKKNEYKVTSGQYKLKRNQGRVWSCGSPVRFYGFSDEVIAYHQNAEFTQQLNLEHENLFKSIYYLGPLRTKTDRLYSWGGITPESVGFSGENTISAMLAAKERKISLGFKKPNKPLEEVIAGSLKRMGLIEKFRVKKISDQRQEYEVNIQTKGSKDWVDLPDVGFGLSQVLPVLVQCFYAPENSIIIMEQPEIHLHPSAQSVLADVMIDVINSRENGVDRNIQLIIETHSEHFLRRLQRRIAENSIQQDKVSAYFSKVDRISAKLESLDIDMFGNILNWPTNFFGDEMADITGQAKAAMEKRISQPQVNKECENE